MNGRINLLFLCLTLVLSGCKVYAQGGPVVSQNGLSCQNYSDYVFFESAEGNYTIYERRQGAECSYICPDGTVRQPLLKERFSQESEMYSAARADLDPQYCGLDAPVVATPTTRPSSPTPSRTPTPRPSSTPTIVVVETTAVTTPPPPSPTAGSTAVSGAPLLTGRVTMCDTGANLISFRLVVPTPDLAGRIIVVSVAGQRSLCSINRINPSLLTCTMPAGQTFPAPVLVTLDGQVVNDFIFDGVGCTELSTPAATTTP